MSGVAAADLQAAIDFLSSLEADEVDWAALYHSTDYGAIVRMARNKGVETDEPALREAFAMIMRARLVALGFVEIERSRSPGPVIRQ